jgi:N-acetylglucosamine-6-phosphate deacetylase
MLALTAANLVTPQQHLEQPLLLVEDGTVLELSTRATRELPGDASLLDFGDATLAPAFIDLHIHGGAGFDVMQADAAALPAIEGFLALHGVGSYFPTTVTAPVDATCAALDRLASAIESAASLGAGNYQRSRPLGIHLEGPFISHVRRGVHTPADLLAPTLAMFDRFWQASRGQIRIMTIAPELEGAMEVIAEAVRRGVCVSMGHSDADYHSARNAVDAGARHATHTFNAMRPLSHRDPGIAGEVLTDPRVSAEIIADGIHVDPAVVSLFLRCKGPDSAVLVTDAISATGMPDGTYRLGSLSVEVKQGKCLSSEGRLAGSVLTLDRAVRNLMEFTGCDLQQAVQAATANPARTLRLERKGTLTPGSDADVVVLSPTGEVRQTMIAGRV